MAFGSRKGASKTAKYSRLGALSSGDAQVQNVKSAKVHVFGNDDVTEEEERIEYEMPEMRSRKSAPGHPSTSTMIDETPLQEQFFETEIQDGETLQALSLKYASSVSELKRLNNLIQDQDFFALKYLKVPMTKDGILSEKVARGELGVDPREKHLSKTLNGDMFSDHSTGCNDESDSQQDLSDPDTQLKVMRTISIRENFSKQGKEAEKFLKKMDADLRKLKLNNSSTAGSSESLNEVISMLTNKSIHPLTMPNQRKKGGDYCGITFKNVVVTLITVAIVVPFVFGLMTLYHNHKS